MVKDNYCCSEVTKLIILMSPVTAYWPPLPGNSCLFCVSHYSTLRALLSLMRYKPLTLWHGPALLPLTSGTTRRKKRPYFIVLLISTKLVLHHRFMNINRSKLTWTPVRHHLQFCACCNVINTPVRTFIMRVVLSAHVFFPFKRSKLTSDMVNMYLHDDRDEPYASSRFL